jgi:DNA ligase-1
MLCGDLGEVARAALVDGPQSLSKYAIQLFRPIEPMLASPAESVSEAIDAFGEAAFELKLDGARIQVHKSGGQVRVFSRALRDVTSAVPEVVEAVASMPANDLILDGEVLALQPDGTPLPFQETMRRFGRRLEVDRLRTALPLKPFFSICTLTAVAHPRPQRARFAALQCWETCRSASGHQWRPRLPSSSTERLHAGTKASWPNRSNAMPPASRKRMAEDQGVRTLISSCLPPSGASPASWLSNLHLGARTGGTIRHVGKRSRMTALRLLACRPRRCSNRKSARGHIVYVRRSWSSRSPSTTWEVGILAGLRCGRGVRYRPDKAATDADTLQTLQAIYRTMTGRQAPSPRL